MKKKKGVLGTFDEYDRNARKTGRMIVLFPHDDDPKKAVDVDGNIYKEMWPGAYSRGFFKFMRSRGI